MSDKHEKVSKFLSYILRHRPDEIGLTLDANGWVSVAQLIEKANAAGQRLTPELIAQVVPTSSGLRSARTECGFAPARGTR